MEDVRLDATLISPVTVDPDLEKEIEDWEGEGGAVLHSYEPTAEGDYEEEG